MSRMTQREIANKLAKQSEAHKAAIERGGERAERERENVSQIYVYSLGNYVEECVGVYACVCVG